MKVTEMNCTTGEITVRDMTPKEIEACEASFLDAEKNAIKQEIDKLESSITPRRLREAIMNESSRDFIASIESEIAQLRSKL